MAGQHMEAVARRVVTGLDDSGRSLLTRAEPSGIPFGIIDFDDKQVRLPVNARVNVWAKTLSGFGFL